MNLYLLRPILVYAVCPIILLALFGWKSPGWPLLPLSSALLLNLSFTTKSSFTMKAGA